jgi:DNA polymerase-1
LIDASRLRYGIDQLALDLLNFKKIETAELIGKGKNQITMDRVPMERISCYAAEDADIALRLCDLMEKKLDEIPALRKLADEVEIPLIDVLVEMENNGIAIDPRILKEQSAVLSERIDALRAQIIQEAGCDFNPDSPKQLGEVLFTKLSLRVVKKTKTGLSTDVEVLEKLAIEHPVPRLMLEYRSLVKLKNTYLDNLTDYLNRKTGRIHGSFNQTGASTGRLSMSDPNLQNIPIRTDEGRRIRLAFVPGDPVNNVLLTADYSQIELRVLTHFTQEPALLKAFEADEDIHRAVASEVFATPLEQVTREQRNYAKTINFGIIYGVSAYGLARRIEGLDQRGAQELINAYNKRFPSIKRFLEECVMHAQSHGYVETILGRRRPLPDITSGVIALRNAAERMAINSVVQGSAADLIKVAMVNVYRRMKKENSPSKLLLQVHDELVFETPADKAESEAEWIRQEMTTAMQLKVPLKVEINWGKNWQEGK